MYKTTEADALWNTPGKFTLNNLRAAARNDGSGSTNQLFIGLFPDEGAIGHLTKTHMDICDAPFYWNPPESTYQNSQTFYFYDYEADYKKLAKNITERTEKRPPYYLVEGDKPEKPIEFMAAHWYLFGHLEQTTTMAKTVKKNFFKDFIGEFKNNDYTGWASLELVKKMNILLFDFISDENCKAIIDLNDSMLVEDK